MKTDPNQQANEYARRARPDDAENIKNNLGGKNTGPIRKVWDKVMLLWEMVKDPQAPWASKAIAIGSLIYLISPLDAIPDPIPIFGLTDDVGVILAAVTKLALDLKKYRK
jgi:uncharacterized membrane protein YkvA (DUF1232 family)